MSVIEITSAEQLEPTTTDETLKRVYRYWAERRGGKAYPSRQDIDPVDFAYALGHVSLLEVLHEPLRFRYRLASTSITARLGYEMTGKFTDEVPEPDMRDYVTGLYRAAIARRVPLLSLDVMLLDGRQWRSEALLLPLSSNGELIDMMLIYRVAEPTERRPLALPPEAESEFIDEVDEPLLNDLVAYWEHKRAGRIAPRRADIEPSELRAHLPGMFMLDVIDGGADFRYRLIGTAVVQATGRDSTGRRMSELYAQRPRVLERLLRRFRPVLIHMRPIYARGHIHWVPDRDYRRFVSVAMPLSDDGVTVNMILSEMVLTRQDDPPGQLLVPKLR